MSKIPQKIKFSEIEGLNLTTGNLETAKRQLTLNKDTETIQFCKQKNTHKLESIRFYPVVNWYPLQFNRSESVHTRDF